MLDAMRVSSVSALQDSLDPPLPSTAALSRWRLELDMATCIFAQHCILNTSTTWVVHLRADSSPQGGRDWFVVEYDWCAMKDVGSSADAGRADHATHLLRSSKMKIDKRILPLSILGQRASSAVHKAQHVLRVLGMESESLPFTISRTYSLLTDFGAESSMFNLPAQQLEVRADQSGARRQSKILDDIDLDSDGLSHGAGDPVGLDSPFHRLFAKALPIADCDHSIHHVA